MTKLRNIRHLRQFLAVASTGSVTRAAAMSNVTQSAVTQSIKKLERDLAIRLFERSSNGMLLSPYGKVVQDRAGRAITYLDRALGDVAPMLKLTATMAQLEAIVGLSEAENFALAARKLGVSQPTVHRAVTQFEKVSGRALFERKPGGTKPGKQALVIAIAARLAFSELEQCEADLAELSGIDGGRLVIGALPLARSHILPPALTRFRLARPSIPISVLDGRYEDLLHNVLNGEVDFLIGALRQPAPVEDVIQEFLFEDQLVLLARIGHPILNQERLTLGHLRQYPWVVPSRGTPTRHRFDELFPEAGLELPAGIIESGSLLLMREMLEHSDHLGFISRLHAESEIRKGHLVELPYRIPGPNREIGLTYRRNWVPTQSQKDLLSLIREIARDTQMQNRNLLQAS